MHKNSRILFVLLPALLCLRCQYPLNDLSSHESREYLQFEAEITPFYAFVKVTNTSSKLAGNPRVEQVRPVEDLYITDSRGARYDMPLNGGPHFSFRGEIGETYVLHAVIQGKTYESAPELLRPAPEIDSVTSVFSTRSGLAENQLLKHGFDVSVRYRDFPEKGNYYQWVWTHYDKRFRCNILETSTRRYNIPCDRDCWDIVFSRDILIYSDFNNKSADLTQPLVRVPYLRPPLKYYLMVEQRAIGKNVYDYLYSAREQTQSNGGQFDVPAQTRFSTNIFCTSDADEKVLGVLNVFDVRRKVYYVDRGVEIPGVPVKFDGEALLPTCPFFGCSAPCNTGKFVTDERPEGWIE